MSNPFTVTQLNEHIWNFTEDAPGTAVDAYLVRGSRRALFIDTLQEARGVYAKARELTSLPMDVAITHGHYDHAGASTNEFKEAGCTIYLARADWEVARSMVAWDIPAGEYFTGLADGQTFDLGGISLTVMSLPGHTPGSVVLLDEASHTLISGDSIGSGPIWLQLPHSLPLSVFQAGVERLQKKVGGWQDITILPGHRGQANGPLGQQYIEDVKETARLVRRGELQGETQTMRIREQEPIPFAVVQHGLMQGFFYAPDRLEE